MKIAAISDLHIDKNNIPPDYFKSVSAAADLLIIGGDMNNGQEQDIIKFQDMIREVTVPIVIVFGNHDARTRNLPAIARSLETQGNVKVLDGDYVEYCFNSKKLGIAGAKGFCGGFAPHRMGSGEGTLHDFAAKEWQEAGKLSEALEEMREAQPDVKLVLTHYAPFIETIHGEPLELTIVLGSSLMGDVIKSYDVTLALSGHAHHGSPHILTTKEGVCACNIAYDVNDTRISLFTVTDTDLSQSYL